MVCYCGWHMSDILPLTISIPRDRKALTPDVILASWHLDQRRDVLCQTPSISHQIARPRNNVACYPVSALWLRTLTGGRFRKSSGALSTLRVSYLFCRRGLQILGESADLLWAPVSYLLIDAMYHDSSPWAGVRALRASFFVHRCRGQQRRSPSMTFAGRVTFGETAAVFFDGE